MAMNRCQYPDDWEEIALRLKRESKWKCEHCGHDHDPVNGYCLTVHHLDMDTTNNDDDNLVALCQRCHLSIQSKWKPGQQWLFDPPAWAVSRGHVVTPGQLSGVTMEKQQ